MSPFQPCSVDLLRQNTREWTQAFACEKANELRGWRITITRCCQNGTTALHLSAGVTSRKVSQPEVQVNTLVESSHNTDLPGTNYTIHTRSADRSAIHVWISTAEGRTNYKLYFFIRCRNDRYEMPSRSAALVCTPPL